MKSAGVASAIPERSPRSVRAGPRGRSRRSPPAADARGACPRGDGVAHDTPSRQSRHGVRPAPRNRPPSRRAPRRCAAPARAAEGARSAGVRLKRGDGVGWRSWSKVVNTPRARMCGIVGGLVEIEHRSEAGVAPRRDRHPLVARAREEDGGEALAHVRPAAAIVLRGQAREVEPERGDQLGVEARLERPDGDELAVARPVAAVEGRAAVDAVSPAGRSSRCPS